MIVVMNIIMITIVTIALHHSCYYPSHLRGSYLHIPCILVLCQAVGITRVGQCKRVQVEKQNSVRTERV